MEGAQYMGFHFWNSKFQSQDFMYFVSNNLIVNYIIWTHNFHFINQLNTIHKLLWEKQHLSWPCTYSQKCHLSHFHMQCDVFTNTMSLLHLVIFRHPYLTHTKSNFRNFSVMNSSLHFLHIYHLDFYLKKTSCLQSLRKFYGVTSFSRYPRIEIIFYEN
jgi:hypothetical protein